MQRNFINTLFWGTPLSWGCGYQTIIGMFDFDEDPIPMIQSPTGNAAQQANMLQIM